MSPGLDCCRCEPDDLLNMSYLNQNCSNMPFVSNCTCDVCHVVGFLTTLEYGNNMIVQVVRDGTDHFAISQRCCLWIPVEGRCSFRVYYPSFLHPLMLSCLFMRDISDMELEVSRRLLLLAGDVETNPGPSDVSYAEALQYGSSPWKYVGFRICRKIAEGTEMSPLNKCKYNKCMNELKEFCNESMLVASFSKIRFTKFPQTMRKNDRMKAFDVVLENVMEEVKMQTLPYVKDGFEIYCKNSSAVNAVFSSLNPVEGREQEYVKALNEIKLAAGCPRNFEIFSYAKFGRKWFYVCRIAFGGLIYNGSGTGLSKIEAKACAMRDVLKCIYVGNLYDAVVEPCWEDVFSSGDMKSEGFREEMGRVKELYTMITAIPVGMLKEYNEGLPTLKKFMHVVAKIVLYLISLWKDHSLKNFCVNLCHLLLDFGADQIKGWFEALYHFFLSVKEYVMPDEGGFEEFEKAVDDARPSFMQRRPEFWKKYRSKKEQEKSEYDESLNPFSDLHKEGSYSACLLTGAGVGIAMMRLICFLYPMLGVAGSHDNTVWQDLGAICKRQEWKNISSVCGSVKSISNLIECFFKLYKWIATRMRGGNTPEELACTFFSENQEEIVAWQMNCDEFLAKNDVDKTAKSVTLRRRVHQLFTQGVVFSEGCMLAKQPAHMFSTLRSTIAKLTTLQQSCTKGEKFSFARPEPVVVYLYGAPGQGKSVVTTTLVKSFAKWFDIDIDVASHSITSQTKHYDGFCNQPILVIDDIGQAADQEDWSTFCQLVSTTPFIVPKADLQSKGTYFTSPIVIATSNDPDPKPKTVLSHDAVKRRLHFKIELEAARDCAKNGKLDVLKAVAEDKFDDLSCVVMDVTAACDDVVGEVGLADLVERVKKEVVCRQIAAERMKDAVVPNCANYETAVAAVKKNMTGGKKADVAYDEEFAKGFAPEGLFEIYESVKDALFVSTGDDELDGALNWTERVGRRIADKFHDVSSFRFLPPKKCDGRPEVGIFKYKMENPCAKGCGCEACVEMAEELKKKKYEALLETFGREGPGGDEFFCHLMRLSVNKNDVELRKLLFKLYYRRYWNFETASNCVDRYFVDYCDARRDWLNYTNLKRKFVAQVPKPIRYGLAIIICFVLYIFVLCAVSAIIQYVCLTFAKYLLSEEGAYDGVHPRAKAPLKYVRPKNVYHKQGSGAEEVNAFLAHQVVRVKALAKEGDKWIGCAGQGFMFDGKTLGVPEHVLTEVGKPEFIRVFINKGYVDCSLEFGEKSNVAQVYIGEDPQDYVLIRVPQIAGYRNVVKHLAKENVKIAPQLLVAGRNENSEVFWIKTRRKLVSKKIKYDDYVIAMGVGYDGWSGGPGCSGAAVIADIGVPCERLLGFHVCGNEKGLGAALLLTQQEILPIMEFFEEKTSKPIAPPREIVTEPVLGEVPTLGTTTNCGSSPCTSNLARNSDLKETVLFGELHDPQRAPCVLRKSDPRIEDESRRFDPVLNCTDKFSDPVGCVPKDYLKNAVRDTGEELASVAGDRPRLLTEHESVNGLGYGESMDKINMKSSPGLPYVQGKVPTDVPGTYESVPFVASMGKASYFTETETGFRFTRPS